ncbi:hypothetical protein ARAM_002159 [Aspergillus rambellii]|uniref:Short chain type dehydrogenase n=1 Tax=Aspergillus rambellii TaxID=308745 RepID=A0A0F8XID1_9EURO|nr:hypothetical protein ARAM_002159 [Aspergillus rambellii]
MSSSPQAQALAGKTAIISGSSAGIGAAIAQELSTRGANIVLNYPFPSQKEECEQVGQGLGGSWIAVEADLSTLPGPAYLVEQAVKAFGPIDILVNNAARVPHQPVGTIDPETWEATFRLNVRGTLLLTQAALPHLRPRKEPSSSSSQTHGGSRIICIGSGTSRWPEDGMTVYSSTKGALESMVRVWAKELPPKYGCTVNCVAPGPVNTKTFRDGCGDALDEVLEHYAKLTPAVGAVAEPEDVAYAVACLADERAKWINGQYIQVNGGMLMS